MLFVLAACGAKEEPMGAKELKLQVGDLKKLLIDNKNGEIEIVGNTDSDVIQVTAHVSSNHINKDKLKLDLQGREDTAYLDASFKGQFLSMGSGSVNLQIKVPKHLQLEIKSHKDGNIRVSDMSSEVKIDNVNGNIDVLNTKGPLNINSRDGDLNLHDITSDIEIDNINGHIKVAHVDGSAVIDVGDGTLDIDHVGKDAMITQSGNGKIKIGDVKGTVTQKTK
ncbi:hypothetical protein FHS14_001597 [Paenibacillus baekrokdamisoli]|nr:hypothetical protein [Paenibacillus baekrokdamisoli]MBB3068610.1 hypothetical protein [Paenibacillus baekrokdamisoli]